MGRKVILALLLVSSAVGVWQIWSDLGGLESAGFGGFAAVPGPLWLITVCPVLLALP